VHFGPLRIGTIRAPVVPPRCARLNHALAITFVIRQNALHHPADEPVKISHALAQAARRRAETRYSNPSAQAVPFTGL